LDRQRKKTFSTWKVIDILNWEQQYYLKRYVYKSNESVDDKWADESKIMRWTNRRKRRERQIQIKEILKGGRKIGKKEIRRKEVWRMIKSDRMW
jgi:hypothetical protein